MNPQDNPKYDLSAPHFPFKHLSTIEKVAESLDKFAASLFNWQHDSVHRSASEIHTDVSMLRCELDQLDEKIRFTFLHVEIFRRGLKTALEAYKELNFKREEKLREIDEILTQRGFAAQLPPEILTEICAYAHNYPYNSLENTLDGRKTWGNFISKSSALWVTIPKILEEQGRCIAKQSSRLHVVVDDYWVLDQVMSYPSVLDNVPKESWTDIYFKCQAERGHDTCFAMLENCAEYVPEMKNIGFWCKYVSTFDDDSQCQGCVQGVEAGLCQGLYAPLTYLPCISQMFVGGKLRYLIAALFSNVTRSISWYLSRFRIDALYSLVITGPVGFLATSESDQGVEVAMPSLRKLCLRIDEMRCGDVISIMSSLWCNDLEIFELRGLAAQEPMVEPTVEEGIANVSNNVLGMFNLVDSRCKKIRSLVFNAHYPTGYLLELSDDGRAIFPMTDHMLIPYHGGHFDGAFITDFLVKRQDEHKAPIHILEIAVPPAWTGPDEEQRGEIERLALHVHTVIVRNAAVH